MAELKEFYEYSVKDFLWDMECIIFNLDLYIFLSFFLIYFLVVCWISLFVVIYLEIFNWLDDQMYLFFCRLKCLYLDKKIAKVKYELYIAEQENSLKNIPVKICHFRLKKKTRFFKKKYV